MGGYTVWLTWTRRDLVTVPYVIYSYTKLESVTLCLKCFPIYTTNLLWSITITLFLLAKIDKLMNSCIYKYTCAMHTCTHVLFLNEACTCTQTVIKLKIIIVYLTISKIINLFRCKEYTTQWLVLTTISITNWTGELWTRQVVFYRANCKIKRVHSSRPCTTNHMCIVGNLLLCCYLTNKCAVERHTLYQ